MVAQEQGAGDQAPCAGGTCLFPCDAEAAHSSHCSVSDCLLSVCTSFTVNCLASHVATVTRVAASWLSAATRVQSRTQVTQKALTLTAQAGRMQSSACGGVVLPGPLGDLLQALPPLADLQCLAP